MEKQLTDLFSELAKKHRVVVSNYLQKQGIYLGQHRTLFKLQNNPNSTLTDLAEKLEVSKESLSVSVKRLVNVGMIYRSTDSKDKRRTLLSLTEKGEKTADICRIGFERINQMMFKDFSDNEKDNLSFYFEKMIDALEEEVEYEADI